ncbi:VanZ family protein [Pseudalkalibacillus hwajinpoensis]|uniref:VanZ family protein n=1 Tax=Guptibacillus hwajinpoensis TaxID=208199 RepID=UPI00325C3390
MIAYVSKTAMLALALAWFFFGLMLSSIAVLTLVGVDPSSHFEGVVSSYLKSKEIHYGPLTLSIATNGEAGVTYFIIRKLGHFFVYSFVSIVLMSLLHMKPLVLKPFLIVLVTCVLGVMDEFIQAFLPSRTALMMDVFVDTAGGVHGVLLYLSWQLCRKWKAL